MAETNGKRYVARAKGTGSFKWRYGRKNYDPTGYLVASDGTRKYASIKGRATKEACEELAQHRIAEHEKSILPPDPLSIVPTMGAHLDHWLGTKCHLAVDSLRKYKQWCRILKAPFAERRLDTIRLEEIQTLFASFRLNHTGDTPRHFRAFLVEVFGDAFQQEHIRRNIAIQLPKIQKVPRRDLALTEDIFRKLVQKAGSPQLRAYLILARCGLRMNEILGLTAERISGNEILICEQLGRLENPRGTKPREIPALVDLKSANSLKTIRLSDPLMQVLHDSLDSAKEVEIYVRRRKAKYAAWESRRFVIPSPTGSHWRHDHIRPRLHQLGAQVGLPPGFRWHDLKALFIVESYDHSGVDRAVVSMAAGHHSVSQTDESYNRRRAERFDPLWRFTAERIEAALAESAGGDGGGSKSVVP